MPYVTSIEQLALKQGRQEGLQEGQQKGRQEGLREGQQKGRQEGLASLVLGLLAQRFGPLPATAEERIKTAPAETLENWGRRLLDARSIDEVFA